LHLTPLLPWEKGPGDEVISQEKGPGDEVKNLGGRGMSSGNKKIRMEGKLKVKYDC
jgi:hypothetical protein